MGSLSNIYIILTKIQQDPLDSAPLSSVNQILVFLRTVPTSITAHTFCASRETRFPMAWVVLTNTAIFLSGLKLYGESRT